MSAVVMVVMPVVIIASALGAVMGLFWLAEKAGIYADTTAA